MALVFVASAGGHLTGGAAFQVAGIDSMGALVAVGAGALLGLFFGFVSGN